MPILIKKQQSFARSPTLETVKMVEETINKYSGEFNKTQIWKRLPKKVMWQTYLLIIDYLMEINKITIDRNDTLGYIWNPKLAKILKKRPEVKI